MRIKLKLLSRCLWDFLSIDIEMCDANHKGIGSGDENCEVTCARLERGKAEPVIS